MTSENPSSPSLPPATFSFASAEGSSHVLSAHWDQARAVLDLRCAGVPDLAAIATWKAELWSIVQSLPVNQDFRVLVDLTGYEVDQVQRETHFAQRTVIPELFAAHGFLAGYLNLYAEKPEVVVGPENRRIRRCATVHHDAFKMESYQRMFGRADDGYFSVRSEAEAWLTAGG